MVTFNPDSLDFVDDEQTLFGTTPDFGLGFNSTNTRLELDDKVNAVTSYVPQSRSGDLADGRLSQTVDEGKVLGSDGNVYDTVSAAISNAIDWIKLGPGTFGSFDMIHTGLTVVGSGDQTVIEGSGANAVLINDVNQTLRDLTIKNPGGSAINTGNSADTATVKNVTITDTGNHALQLQDGTDHLIANCHVHDTKSGNGIQAGAATVVGCRIENTEARGFNDVSGEVRIAYNTIKNTGTHGIVVNSNSGDAIIIGNRIHKTGNDGIHIGTPDSIVANNRISDSATVNIDDRATGTVLDANLTGPAN